MGKATSLLEAMIADQTDQAGRWTREQAQAWAAEYWEIRWDKSLSDQERADRLIVHENQYRLTLNVEVNERGNTIIRRHLSADRYMFDFDEEFVQAGWEQFDTDQDAWYFGTWVNKQALQTISYCEGDITLVICPDAAHFNAEIEDACQFYGEGFELIACDMTGFEHLMLGAEPAGDISVLSQNRQKFFLR